jgi:hypothetical protein
MKIRVIDVARPSTFDIDPDGRLDVAVLDSLLKRCVAALTNSLKSPASRYSALQLVHISWMFEAMGFTHLTIRNLLTQGPKTPACVDALALARLQLEALYSVCLMVQDPSFVDIQSACEVTTLYPADVELKAVLIEAWNVLSEMNLLGRTIWDIRAKSVLGVV